MDGRRFGVGLLAGLLFALAIVGTSGLLSPGGAPSSGSLTESNSSPTVSTTANVPGSAAFGVVTSSTATSTTPLNKILSNLSSAMSAASGSGPSFSSNLASMSNLPSLSRALVLAPIAVAALLGALLYRVSTRRHNSGEHDSAPSSGD